VRCSSRAYGHLLLHTSGLRGRNAENEKVVEGTDHLAKEVFLTWVVRRYAEKDKKYFWLLEEARTFSTYGPINAIQRPGVCLGGGEDAPKRREQKEERKHKSSNP